MITKNNTVIYFNDWVLTESGAVNEITNKRDSKTKTDNAIYYDITAPKPHIGGYYTYDGTNFGYTELGLSYLKEEAKKQINEIRYSRSTSNIPFVKNGETHYFCSNTEEVAEIKQAVNDINSGTVTFLEVTGGYWRDVNNHNIILTEAEFLSASRIITLYVAGLGRESHVAKSLIDSIPNGANVKNDIDLIVENYKNFMPVIT